MDKKQGTLLKGESGNTSSKRVFGCLGMSFFFLLAGGISLYSVYTGNDVGAQAAQLVIMVGVVSGSLLGIGVIEKFGGQKP